MDKNLAMQLEKAIKVYLQQGDQQYLQLADQERESFLKRFPKEEWQTMQLEEYALGRENYKDSYSYWMEWGTPHLGSIRGGSSNKHLIYWGSKEKWEYDTNLYDDEQTAWAAIRSGFVEALEKADTGKWNEIDSIQTINTARTVRLKTLYLYFPDEVLPVYSIDHLRHFLYLLGAPEAKGNLYQVMQLNRELLDILKNIKEIKDFSTLQLSRLLYSWSDPKESRKIVKIAPGEEARMWTDCLNGGYICLGWDEVGDLRKFETNEEFKHAFANIYSQEYKGHKPAITKKGKELWSFRELEIGDIVIANQGISKILAVGEVVEPGYEWLPERQEYKHIVHVKWDTKYAQDIEPQPYWAMVTLRDVPPALYHKITANRGAVSIIPVEEDIKHIAEAIEQKGQVILYGPPGTGKTYNARRFAVWWLLKKGGERDPSKVISDLDAFKQAENRLTTVQIARKVWWMVANPKEWSWETLRKEKTVKFRFGRLKRNYPLTQPGDLVIGYQSTPDKKILSLAKVKNSFDDSGLDLEYLATVKNGLTWDDLLADEKMANSEPLRFRCQGTLFALSQDEADHILSRLLENDTDLEQYLELDESIAPLTRLTFHPSYSYEDFLEGFRPKPGVGDKLVLQLQDGIFKRVCREAIANPQKPYLVFIDEINRGNIAKIFGELITLLEKDKRRMVITLPQSRESFMIPENVYLIGTMNTADRSIKLLDAALRRRFSFYELMPDPELLSGSQVGKMKLDEFLTELNKRIARKEGREKQIGHSFLMDGYQPLTDPEEFARRFRQEILPLLQEYCYDDYGILAEYIGNDLVDGENQTLQKDVLYNTEKLIEALEKALCPA